MVLSGTLKEFILADVFHLLTQQKITGKLFLSDGQCEGAIIFKSGLIVGAERGEETLQNKLFNFLVDVKKKLPEHLNVMFNAHEGNLNALCAQLVDRNLMTVKEVKTFADMTVEDIACSLLMWKKGSYRFNSLRTVDPLICSTVSIQTENIIMEGMRRVDEWNRMQQKFNDDSVFVRADKSASENIEPDVFCKPEAYIYQLLDGSSTVFSLVRSSCLSEYKVYESINILLDSQRVILLPSKISQSIQAALDRKDQEVSSHSTSGIKSFLSSLFSAGILLIILLAGFAYKNLLLSDIKKNSTLARMENLVSYSKSKAINASLLHRAVTGEVNPSLKTLRKQHLLSHRDISPLSEFKD